MLWDRRGDVPWGTSVLVLLFAASGLRELLALLGRAGLPLSPLGPWLAAAILLGGRLLDRTAAAGAEGRALFCTMLAAVVLGIDLLRQGPVEQASRRTGAALTSLGFLVAMALLLDLVLAAGPLLALLVVLLAKLGDIGGYLIGRFLGRHRIAPVLSPKKTWEGTLGGYAFAIAGALVLFPWCFPERWSATWLVLLAVAVQSAGFLGDLWESALKRAAGVKDSGRMLPELGGALDLVDSVVLSAPLGYAMLQMAGRGGVTLP